jgi:hypothetical protein
MNRKLSMILILVEKPLYLITCLILLLGLIFFIMALAAHHLWGSQIEQFRTLQLTLISMMSLFSLHSTGMVDDIYDLYKFKALWGFFFIIFYIIFLQFSYMNIFTAIYFELQRVNIANEEALMNKHKKLLSKESFWKQWIGTLCACIKGNPCKRDRRRSKKEDSDESEDEDPMAKLRGARKGNRI